MNLYIKTVVYYVLCITTPIFCLYEDQRLGVEVDVNGKQEEKYDDSLISSHNFRKKQGDTFSGWRRSNDLQRPNDQYRQHLISLKNQINNLRRNAQKPNEDKEARSNKIGDVIDVKFRKDTPKRRANYDLNADFAYHDKMGSAGAGNVDDFEKNLNAFGKTETQKKLENAVDYLHGGVDRPSRRSGIDKHVNNEKEILFHHAVPIDMKIYGYLQLPLEE